MCWTTHKKKYASPRIAEDDIYVYKIVELRKRRFNRIEFASPYWLFRYKLNKIYHQELNVHEGDGDLGVLKTIDEGLHCTASRKAADLYLKGTVPLNTVVMLAVIPKGTKYYVNERDEIVTEALKIVL